MFTYFVGAPPNITSSREQQPVRRRTIMMMSYGKFDYLLISFTTFMHFSSHHLVDDENEERVKRVEIDLLLAE